MPAFSPFSGTWHPAFENANLRSGGGGDHAVERADPRRRRHGRHGFDEKDKA
jgi:hypothetical protein